jgi:hypothetical protein
MPRFVQDELWNDTDEFAQLVEIYTPPGMEQTFAAAGAAAAAAGRGLAAVDKHANAHRPSLAVALPRLHDGHPHPEDQCRLLHTTSWGSPKPWLDDSRTSRPALVTAGSGTLGGRQNTGPAALQS